MMFRALVAFLALPAVVAGLVPLGLSRLSGPLLYKAEFGALPLSLGLGILIASVVSFYRRGQGTLAPWDPPRHLVVQDLYRFNRNPMYVGVVAIVLGWALLEGSAWVYGYAVLLPIVFHLRVVLYEEREMQRLFGEEWDAYRESVPRWGLRLQG